MTAKDLSKALQSEIYRYAKNNLAKVNIYIKDPYVAKYVTEEKITEIAFVGEQKLTTITRNQCMALKDHFYVVDLNTPLRQKYD